MKEAAGWLLLFMQLVALVWLGVEVSRAKEAQRSAWAMARELHKQHQEINLLISRLQP